MHYMAGAFARAGSRLAALLMHPLTCTWRYRCTFAVAASVSMRSIGQCEALFDPCRR